MRIVFRNSKDLDQFRLILTGLFLLLITACGSGNSDLAKSSNSFSTSLPIVATRNTLANGNLIEPATPTPQLTSTASSIVEIQPTLIVQPTETPVSTIESVRFAVIGDYGSSGKGQENVSGLVKSWNPDFIITTGDNNYPNGEATTIDDNIGQYYAEFIHPYKGFYGPGAEENRFFPTLGNHDWNTPDLKPYLDYFTLPGNERYYDFIWGPVHLFAIDSDSREPDGVSANSTQASWLKRQLSTSDKPWKLVYMHHSPYSSAQHGSIEWMRWPFDEWGATVLLAGHDHVYERLLVDGFPYFINGLGGTARYLFFFELPGSQVRYRAEHGAMLIEANQHQITFQFITHDGETIDSYTMKQ